MPPVISKGKQDNTIKLGLNLFDISNINPLLRPYILGGRLDMSTPIWVDKARVDETALVFKCDLLEAALTIDIVRNEQRKKGEPPIRAYIHRKAWSRLPGSTVLTVLGEAGAELDKELFALEEELAPLAPPSIEKIIIGKS